MQGGYDAVIGNPPYLRIQGLQEYYSDEIKYFSQKYKSAVKRFDLYLLFTEKVFSLLNDGGILGFICPHKFVNSDFGSRLRKYLLDNETINTLISFGNNLIFAQVSTYTGLLFLKRQSNKDFKYYEFSDTKENISNLLYSIKTQDFTIYELQNFSDGPWVLAQKHIPSLLQTLSRQSQTLEDVSKNILVGVQSGIDNVHVMEFRKEISADTLSCFQKEQMA